MWMMTQIGMKMRHYKALLIQTLRSGCNRESASTVQVRQVEQSDECGARQSSEVPHCGPHPLDTWCYPVHTHRTGLDEGNRYLTGNSGSKEAGDGDNSDERSS